MNKRKIYYFSGTSVYDNGVDVEKYFKEEKEQQRIVAL